jgi:hypothetical protein
MSVQELLEEIKKLPLEKKELVVAVEEMLQENKVEPVRQPFRSSNYSLEITPSITFSRDEMYDDEGRLR